MIQKNKRHLWPIVLLTLALLSCGKKTVYNGDSMNNYPDIQLILNDYLDEDEPFVYTKIHMIDDKKDTSFVKGPSMPWKEIKETFLATNIYDSCFDQKYIIDVLQDTSTRAFTLHFKALSPELFTQIISINSNSDDRKIRSVYIETADPGLFSSTYQRLLFIPGKTIQIQERKKKLFSKEKTNVTTYKFQ